ncbi:hypothetical protein GCM10010174_32050 [Kutzneria viridogrisea]|uniref:Uncharacterized protein n=1 Tax=Kutzneria viridogrisea TaxID=47990 RepID=A0ABR6BQK6_9PSEU|nr:hypothetical protein [Kutzneria viridogrisea]
MTWQSELRELDAALREQRISPADYRRRRDHLLAEASGGMPPGPNTPVMRPADQPGQSEVVPPWSPLAPQPQPAQQPQQPAPSQQPILPMPGTPYQSQPSLDADVFSVRATRPRRSGRGLVLVVVVVLGLGVGWWFGFGPGTGGGTSPTESAGVPTNAVVAQAVTVDKLPQLPGTARADKGKLSLDDGVQKGLFTSAQADLLAKNSVTDAVFTGSGDQKTFYLVFAFNSSDQARAEALLNDLLDFQKLGGFTPAQVSEVPKGVSVVRSVTGQGAQFRALYRSGRSVLVIAAAQAAPADEQAVASAVQDATRRTVTGIAVG